MKNIALVAAIDVSLFLLFICGIILPRFDHRAIVFLLLAVACVDVLVICGLLFFVHRPRRWFINLVVLFVAGAVFLSLADMVMRPMLIKRLCFRPHEMFLQRNWPAMPLVCRYKAGSFFSGSVYGDLPAITGKEEDRQYRQETFVTDGYGFRNYKDNCKRVFDILVLGDSFLAGNGVDQEKILPALLSSLYGFNVYNLSMPGASPWDEYVNLAIEHKRLKTRSGTIVLWGLFEGNDLFEYYGPTTVIDELPWRNFFGRLRADILNFRSRSVVGAMIRRVLFKLQGNKGSSGVIARDLSGQRRMLFNKEYYAASKYSYADVLAQPNYKKMAEVFAAMAGFAQANGLKVEVFIIPSKESVYSWLIEGKAPWSGRQGPGGFSVAVRELVKKNSLGFLDLEPYFVRASIDAFKTNAELLWWLDDTHWSPAGHLLCASVIYDTLLSSSGIKKNGSAQ